jgi:hypothetical protein
MTEGGTGGPGWPGWQGGGGQGPQPGPPPGQAPQPSWAPRPGYDPSAWQPMPAWQQAFDPRTQPPWPPPGHPVSRSRRNGCLIAIVAALGLSAVLVGGCVFLLVSTLGPALDVSTKMTANSDGQISYVSYNWYNGVGQFSITLAPGVPDDAGPAIACNVVRPTLRGTQYENDRFAIYNAYGYLVADWRTPCG